MPILQQIMARKRFSAEEVRTIISREAVIRMKVKVRAVKMIGRTVVVVVDHLVRAVRMAFLFWNSEVGDKLYLEAVKSG